MKSPMMLKMRMACGVISAIAILFLSCCSPSSGLVETEVVNTAMPLQQNLKTTMGDFLVVSARLVDEVHDSKAPDGYKFLLIGLARPGLQKLVAGEFSLESFQAMMLEDSDKIYISGKDGSQTFYSQMGGWVEDDFVIGFTVPLIEAYTLYWPNNAPIPLNIEK